MSRRFRRLLRTIPLLAGVIAAVAVAAPPASAVIGGSTSGYGPWGVRMLVDGKPECTGTAVAPRWVLSASHCFFEQPSAPFADNRLAFRVGSLDQRTGTLVHPVAGKRVQSPTADMTLIEVEPMKVTPARLVGPSGVHIGQTVRQYGWGATCTGDENSCQSDVLRQSDLRVLDAHEQRCFGFGSTDGTDFCAGKVTGEPAGGDSGGPLTTVAAPGSEVLVGVLAGSDRDSTAGAGAMSRQLGWIHSVIG